MLYFDHNATSPLIPAARAAWLDAAERYPGNPSSPHRLGARADAALTLAREKLAGWLDCAAEDIIWTSGATESNNAVMHQAAQGGTGEVWISNVEHPCVIAAADRYFPRRQQRIPVTRDGIVNVAWLADALERGAPALVGVMAANNETGVLQPWRDILKLCRKHKVPFFCDAAQWIGKMPVAGLGACDFVSGCAHKFGGPQGVGFLKASANFRSLIVGGPQEEGRRAGTENVAGVLAMIAALETRLGMEAPLTLRTHFEAALRRAMPDAQILGESADRLWNTVSVIMPAVPDCRQRWVVKLDKLGFAVSTGSACASGKEKPSHVLNAMGLPSEVAGRVLRFSSGWETRAADWDELLAGLQRAFTELSATH